MKTDAQLKADVNNELSWDPAVKATAVGVAVKGGIVTLTGHLDTYAEKFAAERAAQRVAGVKAVAVEIDVKLSPGHQRNDTEVANAIETAFLWHVEVPQDRVKVKVEKGWVTLSGEVDWEFQRRAAEKAVRPVAGVLGVYNMVSLKPQVAPGDVSQRIGDALTRHAEREARKITVSVTGSTATLRGRVDSLSERNAAQGAAWSAPGITRVINELTIA